MKSDPQVKDQFIILSSNMNWEMRNWSKFTKQLLQEIFHEFLPDTPMKCETTETSHCNNFSRRRL